MRRRKDGWPNPVFRNPGKKIHSLIFASILLLLPTGAPLAAVFSPSWIGGDDVWSLSSNWDLDPPRVPNNFPPDTFRVSISGASSAVTLDLDVAIENLNLSSGAELLINAKRLEVEDGGTQASTITNNGQIYLQGSGAGSDLVINGDVEYLGNGIILFDDNIFHGIEGGGATNQKLYIDANTRMSLQGVGGGGRGTLGGGLMLENIGKLDLTNFTSLDLNAPALNPPPPTPWINLGTIIVEADSTVNLTGKLDQSSSTATKGTLLVSGTLKLQDAHIIDGKIEGAGNVNANGVILERVDMEDTALTCIGPISIVGGPNLFKSIHFDPGANMWVSGSGTALVYGTEWVFAAGSEFQISPSGTSSLTLSGAHTFEGGKIWIPHPDYTRICFNITDDSSLIVSNEAYFGLDPNCSTIEGSIRSENGGSAELSGAQVTGLVGASSGSTLKLSAFTEVTGEVRTSGTGRVIGGYAATLKDATVNGDILLDPELEMSGDISGDFTVHFNGVSGSSHKIEIASGGAHLISGTLMKLSFESAGQNSFWGGPFIIDAGATVKLVGSGKGGLGVTINNGTIETNEMMSGSLSCATNNGTIDVTSNSTVDLYGTTSNEQGSISLDLSSGVNLLGSFIGGKVQGPVDPQRSRAIDLNGAFVGRGGSLEGVTNAATIIIPTGEYLSIKNSLTNEGQIVPEGEVKLLSQNTTFDGGGEVVFTGGMIRGPDISNGQFINNDNTIRGAGMITGYFSNSMPITNRGLVSADQADPLYLAETVTNEGELEASGIGGLKIPNLVNKGTVLIKSGSRLDVARITQQSGNLQISGALVNGDSLLQMIEISGGTFSGGTEVQNLSLTGGTFQIGNGIGEFLVKYTYSQGTNAVLEVELGGYTPGVSYDLIRTNTGGSQFASTNLDGTVVVTCALGFEPKPGDEFTFLRSQSFSGISGKFANVVNATPYALNFELVYGISSVTLRVSDLPTFYVAKDGVCGNNKPCYTSIQAAVNAAGDGSLIKIAQGNYDQSFTLNGSKSLILQGGWNSAYTIQTPNTTFFKAPKAPQGSLKMQMVTIKP